MSTVVKFASYRTGVFAEVSVPTHIVERNEWTDEDRTEILQYNYDRLSIYQLSDLDTETAEYNEESESDLTPEQFLDQLIQEALDTDEIVI